MKAAYASGVLSAFEGHGYRPFDALYGTSAGGALAAWFAAGQARFAEKTWDYAADRRILSYRRFARGGPLLDHEALLDIVYLQEMPIDQEAIRRAGHPVIVTAVDVESGQAVYQDLREVEVIPWLKATGRLPLASGPAVSIAGRQYLDGGIADPIPVRKALADGHKRLTVILNMPEGKRRPDNRLVAGYTARRYPSLRDGIVRHADIKHEALDWLQKPPRGVDVRVVRPSRPTGLSRLTRDLGRIRAAIAQGHVDGEAHLAAVGALPAKRRARTGS